jgi:hypothetical protein
MTHARRDPHDDRTPNVGDDLEAGTGVDPDEDDAQAMDEEDYEWDRGESPSA